MVKSRIAQIVSTILKLMLISGIISLIFIPKLYDMFADKEVLDFSQQTIYYRVAFYACFIGSLCILFELIKIFNNMYKESPFKKSLEYGLKRIAVWFMVLSMIVSVKIIYIPTILSASVALITFIASLSFYVLSQVFKVAIEYKDEIDHTV